MGNNERTRHEGKLNAILAILVDRHIRETGIARPKDRSIDKMLADAGLSAKDIAALLGKTERGVNLQLQKEGRRKDPTGSPKGKRTTGSTKKGDASSGN